MCFLACKFSTKTAINFRNASVSHCFRNSSLTIIWNSLDLSNYKHMKRELGLKKTKTPVIISKRNYSVPYSKESHAFVTSLNHSIVLRRIFC